jgi:hypothetical protein
MSENRFTTGMMVFQDHHEALGYYSKELEEIRDRLEKILNRANEVHGDDMCFKMIPVHGDLFTLSFMLIEEMHQYMTWLRDSGIELPQHNYEEVE